MLPSVPRLCRLISVTAIATGAMVLAAWTVAVDRPSAPSDLRVLGGSGRDLPQIIASGVLRVAMMRDEVTYAVHKGREDGLGYELSAWLAKELGVELEIVAPRNPAHGLRLLASGEADVFATTGPGPVPLLARVSQATPIEISRPMVIGREAASIRSIDDLRGKTVVVRRHSALEASALGWRRDLDDELTVVGVRPKTSDRQLALGAATQRWPLVLLGEHRARLEAAVYEALQTSEPLGAALPVCWSTAANAPELARSIDQLLGAARRRGLIAGLQRRYFENPLRLKARRRPVFRFGGALLSPWDGLFQEVAVEHGFDWRLLAALSFAESGYDPWEVSSVGAVGLLQLMPGVAEAYGAADPFDPAQNVSAGARLLRWLYDLYDEADAQDRLAFALAAYNMGMGHLADARGLAAQRGLDPNRWTGHVAAVLPLLDDATISADLLHGAARGGVTLSYVDHVLGLYAQFSGTAIASAQPVRVSYDGS